MEKRLSKYSAVIIVIAFVTIDLVVSEPEDFDNTPALAFMSEKVIGAHCSSL